MGRAFGPPHRLALPSERVRATALAVRQGNRTDRVRPDPCANPPSTLRSGLKRISAAPLRDARRRRLQVTIMGKPVKPPPEDGDIENVDLRSALEERYLA